MAHDVFVSYSSKDKPVADAIVAGLESRGIRCWFAPRDVTPGTSWGGAIIGAIEGSRIMIVILSGNSNQSRQVIREVERAVANDVVIIPFRIEKIDPTGAMAYFLSTEHWLDALTPPLEEHIEKLGSTVQLFLTEGGSPLVGVSPKEPQPRRITPVRRRRPMWLIGILLSIIAVAVLGMIFIPRWIEKAPINSLESQTMMEASPTTVPPTVAASPTETVLPPTPTPLPTPKFSVMGEYRTSRAANGLFVADNILNLANGGDGLVRLKVSDPTNPIPVDTYQVNDAQEVVVDDDIAYVVSGDDSRHLVIMQLGVTGGSAYFPPEGQGLGGAKSLYYVVYADGLVHLTGHNYWGILDVQDPMNPREIWNWEPPTNSGNPCNAAVDGTIAYIGCGWTGLHIFDIADPHKPELIGEFDTSHWIVGIAVVNDVLYLTMGEGGLIALNVSDPARPLLMDRLELDGFASDLSIAGDTLYVIYNVSKDYVVIESGVIAVNVANPEALAILAIYNELDSASDIQAVGEAVFVTDKARGIIVLNFGASE
jgi:hypothetical protein